MFRNLPAALFSGLRLEKADEHSTSVTVPYKWFTKNPFRSTYFACMSMAAEMSTGILAMAYVYHRNPKVALLVIAVEGRFYKKATGLTRFKCVEGALIRNAVETAINLQQPQTVRILSEGFNPQGEKLAEFWITWSFKARSKSG
jgi:hypothetical protein